MGIVAVYSGRFQPFGRHHKAAFDWLCSIFGAENCWIATSNAVDDRSPLSFDEKRSVIKKYGIENVVLADNPYRPVIPNIDPKNTALVVMLGEKDEGRIKYIRKDGTPAYYREYHGQKDLLNMTEAGYIIISPRDISVLHNGNQLCGTYIRKTLSFAPRSTFEEIMGFYDPDIEKMFRDRFGGELEAFRDMMSGVEKYEPKPVDASIDVTPLTGYNSRHICHLYESELPIDEIIAILNGISSNEIVANEKIDGINLKIGVRGGEVVCARTKDDLQNPIDVFELGDRYIGRSNIRRAFMDGYRIICGGMNKSIRQYLESERLWINIEITHPDLNSVYKYGSDAMVFVHGLVNSENNKVNINNILDTMYCDSIRSPNRRILFQSMPLYLSQMSSRLKNETNIRNVINAISYTLLSNATGYCAVDSKVRDRILEVGNRVARTNDPKIRRQYFENLSNFDFGKILPFEGVVFEYRGITYKLTGYYRYVNAIIHLFNR